MKDFKALLKIIREFALMILLLIGSVVVYAYYAAANPPELNLITVVPLLFYGWWSARELCNKETVIRK